MRSTLILFLCVTFSLPLTAQTVQKSEELQLPAIDRCEYQSGPSLSMTPDYVAKGTRVYSGGVRLSRLETRNAFAKTPAYEDYMKGIRFNRIAHGLLWPGVSVSACGALFLIMVNSHDGNRDNGMVDALGTIYGIIFLIPGIPLVIAGTTLKIVANKKVAASVREFNTHRYGDYSAKISFGPTSNGVGFSLLF